MDGFGIVVMWAVAAMAVMIINNDRYGRIAGLREEYWSRYR